MIQLSNLSLSQRHNRSANCRLMECDRDAINNFFLVYLAIYFYSGAGLGVGVYSAFEQQRAGNIG
jgi:hypothetical protein